MSKRSLRWNDGQVDGWEGAVREVVEKELALLRPAVRADSQAVVGLLHEEFREFGASGRMWNQAQIAASLAAETGDVAAEAEDLQAVRLADGVVLLTYRARRPGRVSLRSSLWVSGPAGWQARSLVRPRRGPGPWSIVGWVGRLGRAGVKGSLRRLRRP